MERGARDAPPTLKLPLYFLDRPHHDGPVGRNKMRVSKLYCGALALGCVLATPASAQLLARKDLSASIAITIAQTAIDTCKTNGYAVSVTVVGRNGEILVQVRGDNTGPHTIENSFRKAYTARTFRIPSGAMVDRVKAEPTLGLIHLTNVIANQGALPIKMRARRREGRSLRQGRDRQGRRSAEVTAQSPHRHSRRRSLAPPMPASGAVLTAPVRCRRP
jgi:uncharacterized protein GlcG (DUF336 family)